jgi:succinate dehydrogenase hydrophobic anchor subunit
MRHNETMSKKIDSTLKDLIKALEKHAEVAGERHVSLKRSQRATAKVRAAATAYAAAVHARSGLGNPFDDVIDPALDEETLQSLSAERDAIARTLGMSVVWPILSLVATRRKH